MSAADKGKGVAGAGKRARREIPTLPAGVPLSRIPRSGESPFPVELYDDSSAAAALMAKITYPGERFPIPDMLLNGDLFKEFAARQIKALAHCNRMVIAYDQEARSRQLFIDEAKKKEEAEKKQVAENMALLAAELDAAKKSSSDTFKHLQVVTAEKRGSEKRLAEMEMEMAALKSNREKELEAAVERAVETAVASARRAAVAEVKAQLNSAYDLFTRMMKRPIKHMVYFSQAEANLQLLDDIESATADNPFDPVAERAEIVESKAKFGPANDAFDVIAAELRKILGTNYVVPVNVGDLVFSPRLETVAKSVGVNTASGSNDGSLGLRLGEASDELSDSGDSDGNEPVQIDEGVARDQEAVPVLSQREPPSSKSLVEKPTGEAASSTAPIVLAEEDKEDGEL